MNRLALLLIFSVLFISCTKDIKVSDTNITSNKTVEFSVYGEKDYSDSSFTGLDAEIYLALYKISYRDQKVEKLWDTAFARTPLNRFPQADNPIITTRSLSGIRDHLEYVSAHYSITYRGRYVSAFSSADPLDPGDQFKKIFVGL